MTNTLLEQSFQYFGIIILRKPLHSFWKKILCEINELARALGNFMQEIDSKNIARLSQGVKREVSLY